MKQRRPNEITSWELTLEKFLNREEISKLRKWVKKCKDKKDWIIIELLLNTGIRVQELADLKCGDLFFRDELSAVVVRHGKGDKQREVLISRTFQDEAKEYIKSKEVNKEKIGPDDVLLYSPRSKGKYTTRALQLRFKRILKGAGVSTSHSIHHLRHTYASLLLSSSNNNLPLVQKQLGHSSVTTTQVYTKVFKDDARAAVENLLK
jgi:site-specific recombinase XerD